jgi:hypothetical protein
MTSSGVSPSSLSDCCYDCEIYACLFCFFSPLTYFLPDVSPCLSISSDSCAFSHGSGYVSVWVFFAPSIGICFLTGRSFFVCLCSGIEPYPSSYSYVLKWRA